MYDFAVRILLGALVCGFAAEAANLVVNPSFESLTSCPVNFGQVDRAQGWNSPTQASPDLLNSCAASGTGLSTPSNVWGTQTPASGNGYAFGRMWASVPANSTGDYREYIQGTLTQPLVAGQTYQVSFLVSLAETYTPIAEIGAFLSPTPFNLAIGAVNNGLLNVTPQVVNASGLLSSTVNWMPVAGTFTAAGGEQYIIIGNFLDDGATTAANRSLFSFAMYYVDEVSVSELSEVPEPSAAVFASVGGGLMLLARRRRY